MLYYALCVLEKFFVFFEFSDCIMMHALFFHDMRPSFLVEIFFGRIFITGNYFFCFGEMHQRCRERLSPGVIRGKFSGPGLCGELVTRSWNDFLFSDMHDWNTYWFLHNEVCCYGIAQASALCTYCDMTKMLFWAFTFEIRWKTYHDNMWHALEVYVWYWDHMKHDNNVLAS